MEPSRLPLVNQGARSYLPNSAKMQGFPAVSAPSKAAFQMARSRRSVPSRSTRWPALREQQAIDVCDRRAQNILSPL